MLWALCYFIKNPTYILLVSISLCLCGVVINQYIPFHDRYYLLHALVLMPAISFGYLMKTRCISKTANIVILSSFVLWLIVYRLFKISIPCISQGSSIIVEDIFSYLLFSFLGTITLLYICSIIKSYRPLELVGRASLVVYMTSNLFVYVIGKVVVLIFPPNTFVGTTVFYIVVLVFSILACLVLNHLIESTKLRFLIGKF